MIETMLVTLDENLSIAHAKFLRDEGYDRDRVTDEELSGEEDGVAWQRRTLFSIFSESSASSS